MTEQTAENMIILRTLKHIMEREDVKSFEYLLKGKDPHVHKEHLIMAMVEAIECVDSQRPDGHWNIIYQGDVPAVVRCSECGWGTLYHKNLDNYCANCGADMRAGKYTTMLMKYYNERPGDISDI